MEIVSGHFYMLCRGSSRTIKVIIVANHPRMSGTVPDLLALSRIKGLLSRKYEHEV